MEQTKNRLKEAILLILFTFFILLVLVALYFSFSVFLVALIGLGLGVLVAPILTTFKTKLSIPRALSAVLFFLFIFFAFAGILYGTWHLISDQVMDLIERAPQMSKSLNKKFSTFIESYPWLKEQLNEFSFAMTAKDLASRFLTGLHMWSEAVVGLGFALILAMYTAVSLPQYFKSTLTLFPASRRMRVESILHKCASTLRVWFKAQVTDMLILGAITSISLWAIGVEFWAVYGLMTTLFTIVPYVGILLVVICASLITLASDPSMVIWVLVVFGVTQQIEANVILPLIMKNQVDLPEVPLLIFILFLGVLFGLVGVFIAPPLFAVLKVLYTEIYQPRMNRS